LKIAFWHFYTFRLRRGIENLTISLANALTDKGEDVSIIAANPTLEPLTKPNTKVKIHTFPTGPYLSHSVIVPFYVNHFLKYKYDAVVVFFADFGEAAAWKILKNFQELPLNLYLCYPYSSTKHRYDSFMRLDWHRKAKHVLADAKWIADEAQIVFNRPVATVPFGVDVSRFKPDESLRRAMREKHRYTDKDIVLLNVSSLEPRKGTERTISAISRLKPDYPKLRFFILGKGSEEPLLKKKVQDLGLNDNVVFGGETSELEAYYNMADIFVMLSEDEGNSMACHEAMSCGLPVCVSKTPGFTDYVPSDAGVFADINNQGSIDAVLKKLLNDAPLRKQMGEKGAAYSRLNLSWSKAAERFLDEIKK
jgi:glycosyltransferase involved in cell wall biosynthesis